MFSTTGCTVYSGAGNQVEHSRQFQEIPNPKVNSGRGQLQNRWKVYGPEDRKADYSRGAGFEVLSSLELEPSFTSAGPQT
jgi:hypothetical protein